MTTPVTDDEIEAAIDVMLQGREVYVAMLMYADFAGGPGRYWSGPTTLRTRDGNEWKGAGNLISLDLLSPALGTSAQPATAKLSAVNNDVVALAVRDIDDVVERDVIAYAQFFGDGEDAGPRYVPLGDPIAIGGWVSDQPTFERNNAGERTISLGLESYFIGRSRSPASYYSYSEQVDRAVAMGFSGDEGGAFMAALQNKTIKFPQ